MKFVTSVDIVPSIKKIIDAGIPVMGHIGLMPQSINKYGTYALRANNEEEAQKLRSDAKALEEAGCYAIVIEKVPAVLAAEVAKSVSIPIIGIGAGSGADGQVLVMHDMLGINMDFSPKVLRRYANLNQVISEAVGHYIDDVKSGDFPNENEQY